MNLKSLALYLGGLETRPDLVWTFTTFLSFLTFFSFSFSFSLSFSTGDGVTVVTWVVVGVTVWTVATVKVTGGWMGLLLETVPLAAVLTCEMPTGFAVDVDGVLVVVKGVALTSEDFCNWTTVGAAGFWPAFAVVVWLDTLWTKGSRDPTTGVVLCNSSWMGGSPGDCCKKNCWPCWPTIGWMWMIWALSLADSFTWGWVTGTFCWMLDPDFNSCFWGTWIWILTGSVWKTKQLLETQHWICKKKE